MAVIELGISPEYFLDKMQFYEIPELVKGLNVKHKESWEQTRFISYITAQVNSTKKLKPTDILKFSWDSDVPDKDTSISNDDIQRLKDKSKMIEQKLNKNG